MLTQTQPCNKYYFGAQAPLGPDLSLGLLVLAQAHPCNKYYFGAQVHLAQLSLARLARICRWGCWSWSRANLATSTTLVP